MSSSGLFKLTTVKLVVLALFIVVNVLLYAQSKYVIMETVFHQFSKNRTSTTLQATDTKTSHATSQPKLSSSANSSNASTANSNNVRHHSHLNLDFTFLKEPVINPHNFRYSIKPNVTCENKDIELVICVVISDSNHVGRTVIRKTWGSYAMQFKSTAVLVFFIGSSKNVSDKSQVIPTTQSKIEEEASTFGDILEEDYIDSYENLSLKSVSVLKWVNTFCSNTKFILKVDDDMYVNIPFLIGLLRKQMTDPLTPSAFIMGAMQVDARPIRNPNSKWYTSLSLFSEDTYPNYVSGTAYVMSSQAAVLLYEASLRVPRFWLEDIYITGLCSRKAGVKVYDSKYFSYGKPKVSGCSFDAHVSGHRYTHEEIIQIHKELYDPSLSC